MQHLLLKAKKNISVIVFIMLSTLLFNQTASAQWVMNSGDNGTPSPYGNSNANNYAVIYLSPGESASHTITPFDKLLSPYVSINSAVPYFASAKNVGYFNANRPFTFTVSVPSNIPSHQINYRITLSGYFLIDGSNVYLSFIVDVKPKEYEANQAPNNHHPRLPEN